ncbi:hypothetical protein R3P38DRAFT_2935732 [Favolaschia claudopus]|uniref:Uncharacterized protein n=1 Tax=Favolaschia claudopus TaxID=2862362 RepID=A0AAW0BP75_9AGAR
MALSEEISQTVTSSESPAYYLRSPMFSDSQNFTVSGGTFTTITKSYAATSAPILSDFRTLPGPLGEIDLQQKLSLKGGTLLTLWRPENCSIRQLYSARIRGQKLKVTVAMYQGNGAEKVVS